MALLGNTLVFLDTGFFKKYKEKSPVYSELFKFAKGGGLTFCTAELCLLEWSSQKTEHTWKVVEPLYSATDHRRNNENCSFTKKLVPEGLLPDQLRDYKALRQLAFDVAIDFAESNNIKYEKSTGVHLKRVWDAYFDGEDPFSKKDKKLDRKKDIPDAWILEASKDVFQANEYRHLEHKYAISTDKNMVECLERVGYTVIYLQVPNQTESLNDFIEKMRQEEVGVTNEPDETETSTIQIKGSVAQESESPLDAVLAKTFNDEMKDILLRIIGYIPSLAPIAHDEIIRIVSEKGYDYDLTKSCAIMVSQPTVGILKSTGTHYIVGNQEVCEAAALRVLDEIIAFLNGESDEA